MHRVAPSRTAVQHVVSLLCRWAVAGRSHRLAGLALLLAGAALGSLGICPVVKRIWTPSWTLFSGGWCFLLLAGFHYVTEVRGHRRWAFPLVVIGANSIAAYVIAHLFEVFVGRNLVTHFGAGAFRFLGPAYEPLLHGAAILGIMWLMLYGMFRRRLFLKI